jgi:2'-5' RNA ligase
MSSNLVIVAIPDPDDRVWKISSEKVPHLTLLFLGDAGQVSNLDQIMLFVEHAASTSLKRFYLPVDHRGELGEDKADVLFFKKSRYDFAAVRDFRSLLLKDTNIKSAYDSTQQFEAPKTTGQAGQPWIPHLTLGYPSSPAKPVPDGEITNFFDVNFDRIAVWTGDFEGPEFRLKDYWDDWDEMPAVPMDVAMSDIQHYGVKGMKWGIRKETDAQTYLRIGDTPQDRKDARRDARWMKKNHGVDITAGQYMAKSDRKIFGAAKKTLKPEVKALNKSPEFSGKENRKQLKDPNSALASRYDKAHTELFAKHMQAAVEKHGKTSPSGKWEEKVRVGKDGSWYVGIKKTGQPVRHAAMSDMDYEFFVQPLRDADRLIVDYQMLEIVEDASMAQTSELGEEFLEHFGVKGMKWGVRKAQLGTAVGNVKRRNADRQFKRRAKTADTAIDLMGEAREGLAKDLPAINERHKGLAITKGPNQNLNTLSRVPAQKAYKQEVQNSFLKHLNAAAESKTNSSGTKTYTIEAKSATRWKVKLKDVAHADISEFEVEPVFDSDGYIIDVKFVEETMTQAIDVGEEFLEHFGVKGMHWGVRKIKAGAKAVGRGLAALGAHLADSSWQSSTYSDLKHEAVHNHVAEKLDNRVERLQRSPKYRGKDLKADRALRHEYHQDVAKVSNAAYRTAVKETYGENYTGTKTAHFVKDVRGARIEVRNKKTGETEAEAPLSSMKEIKKRRKADAEAFGLGHADISDAPDLVIELKEDANEQIIGVGFVKPSDETLAQSSADLGAEFVLEHFGVKGMHWGQRKSPPTAVSTSSTSVVPHGTKRKTKIQVEGGENHPAHDDAIRVAEAKAKLKKSGTSALSNQELREMANRLQLENQVAILTSSKGKQFVSREFETTSKQLVKRGTKKGVKRYGPTVAKKAGKAAATAATIAVL